MSTTTSPGLAAGSGSSPYLNSSGPPWRSMDTAFIAASLSSARVGARKNRLAPHVRQRYTEATTLGELRRGEQHARKDHAGRGAAHQQGACRQLHGSGPARGGVRPRGALAAARLAGVLHARGPHELA